MIQLTLKAHAKLNTGLEVIRRREDGYHDINTVFYRLNLADEILIEEGEGISLISKPDLGFPAERNLAYRAAVLFFDRFNIRNSGIKITLEKNIPIGAGLGGGSSDAAAVLLGLNKLFNINAEYDDLKKIASELGSDVPYFLKEGTALVQGRGDIIEYFDWKPEYIILLAYPHIHISTKWAYNSLKMSTNPKQATDLTQLLLSSSNNPELLREKLTNDFENVIFPAYPEIKELKSKLYDYGAVYASMSGSGSPVYGFFENIKSAENARLNLSNYFTYLQI